MKNKSIPNNRRKVINADIKNPVQQEPMPPSPSETIKEILVAYDEQEQNKILVNVIEHLIKKRVEKLHDLNAQKDFLGRQIESLNNFGNSIPKTFDDMYASGTQTKKAEPICNR